MRKQSKDWMPMTLTCGHCCKCEEELRGSFYPGEEWKVQYFKGHAFQIDGVWFIDVCPHYIDGKCTVHDEAWRPLQCQMYPLYLNNDAVLVADHESCPNAHQVDEEFKTRIMGLYNELNLSIEELRAWGRVVAKNCVLPKHLRKI